MQPEGMPEAYNAIIATLEQMVTERGLTLEPDPNFSLEPGLNRPITIAYLKYTLRGENAELYISQTIEAALPTFQKETEEIFKGANVFNLASLMAKYCFSYRLVTGIFVPRDSGGDIRDRIEVEINPDGSVKTNAVALAFKNRYEEVFKIMLDIATGVKTA